MKAELIAPCGMNCRLCYAYIRSKNPCGGCHASNEEKPASCSDCRVVMCLKRNENGWETCAPCENYCRRLKDLDKRYRTKYHMSMIENLTAIRDKGMDIFLVEQEKNFTCPYCSAIVCVHHKECPSCKKPLWE